MSSSFPLPPRFPRFSILVFALLSAFIANFLFVPQVAHSAQVTLAWDPNAESDLAGYKIYDGSSSHGYQFSIDVGNKTTCTLSNLEDGRTYYFAATAYDTSGYESEYSSEVVYNALPECTYSISPSSQSFSPSGGAGTVSVTAQSGCNWTATSNASWLIITSNSSRAGNGTINYSVLANTDSSSRTGILTIAGKIFTVTQSGVSQYTLTVTKAGTGSGNVTTNPSGTNFNAGTVVTLTATPDASSTFSGWSGGCTGTSPNCTVTMNSNTSVTASFIIKTYTITATPGANGSIFPQGAVAVNYGASKAFTITPNAGYRIADVKVDGVSKGAINSYTFTNVKANHTIEASFTESVAPANKVIFAVNAGGRRYVDKAGIVYQADTLFSGGKKRVTKAAIEGTEDDILYQSERFGNFSYGIPVSNGNYMVTLKFAEIYWNAAGKRVFDVKIEGKEVVSNLDLFAQVGKNRVYDVSIPVSITDGILSINFYADVNKAKVSAILIVEDKK